METNSLDDFFEKILPARFNSSKAAGVNVTVQVNITGIKSCNWVVIVKDQKIIAKQGTSQSPNLSLTMSEKDFLDLINRRISAEKSFFSGKVHFRGDITLALKLREAGFF